MSAEPQQMAQPEPRQLLPPLPPGHVARPRLVAALEAGARRSPLTLIAAGPGTGKTVLLADWVRGRKSATAWLALTRRDNDPRRFWRQFLAAIRATDCVDEDLPTIPPDHDAAEALDELFMLVPESATPLVVVLDDAHVLTRPEILDGLDNIVRAWPPRLRLVLAARSDPLLPLHRYRLAGQMSELRAQDLAMDRQEAAQLLAAHGVVLPDREFDVLARRTEGWIAGIRLSGLRMEGTERPADFVTELALDRGSIGEYLMEEVLERQPTAVRRLLIETSFLGEVTGPLADAITGMEGCADMLRELARCNSFVTPLDALQTRFRYHQLLAEVVRWLLRRQSPWPVSVLFGRASAWFEEQGDLQNALHWAAQAQDEPRVASLLVHGGLAQAFLHRQDLFVAGLSDLQMRVPAGAGPARAALIRTARYAIAAITADGRSAAAELERATARRADWAISDPALLAALDLADLILAQKACAAPAVEAAAQRVLAADAQGGHGGLVPGLRALVLMTQASAQFWDGRHDNIETILTDALEHAERDAMPSLQAEILGMIALINSHRSRFRREQDAARQARELIRRSGPPTAESTLDIAAAMDAFAKADFTAMARDVRRALAHAAMDADPAAVAAVSFTQALLLFSCGQQTQARGILLTAPALGGPLPAMLAAHKDMLLADIETALGRPHAALRLLHGYLGTVFAVPTAVPSARAYLALGDLRGAQDCVRKVLAGGSAQVGRFQVVEMVLCDAQIAEREGDQGRALETLVRAMEIADSDIVLPFVRVSDVFAALLSRHPAVAAQWPSAMPAALVELLAASAPGLITVLPEPLTERERTVLRFLATSMSTAEIASQLCLSVNTVKTHLAGTYRKLAARNRREAVRRARQLELL